MNLNKEFNNEFAKQKQIWEKERINLNKTIQELKTQVSLLSARSHRHNAVNSSLDVVSEEVDKIYFNHPEALKTIKDNLSSAKVSIDSRDLSDESALYIDAKHKPEVTLNRPCFEEKNLYGLLRTPTSNLKDNTNSKDQNQGKNQCKSMIKSKSSNKIL